MEKKKLALIPYGDADFSAIRTEGYAYVDKTQFIEVLENTGLKYPLIIRPRRFGKSLFTEMLSAYYDIASADKFNDYFAGTYIGDHKTSKANSFYVLKFDFSGIDSENFIENFIAILKSSVHEFLVRYDLENSFSEINKDYSSPAMFIEAFFSAVNQYIEKKIYILIDEYDQFTNILLSKDEEQIKNITSVEGSLRNFYTRLKANTNSFRPIARIFITGVTTISLDSLSSGFNIQRNISYKKKFASMFGFTEGELKELIPQVVDLEKYGHTVDEVFNRMDTLYNGYYFSPFSSQSVFNSSMCLYYLGEIKANNREPDILLDPAFDQDLSKIHCILSLSDIDFVKKTIIDVLSDKTIPFGKEPSTIDLINKKSLSHDELLSTLIYFGYLTWKESSDSLTIPNRVIAQEFFEYYFKYLRGIKELSIYEGFFEDAFIKLRQGAPEEFVKTVATKFADAERRQSGIKLDKSDFAVALATAANLSSDFKVHLEFEDTSNEKRYADLVLSPLDGVNCSYIFELKYLSLSEGNDEAISEKLNEAKTLLDKCCQDDNIAKLPTLKRVACVFVGTELKGLDLR